MKIQRSITAALAIAVLLSVQFSQAAEAEEAAKAAPAAAAEDTSAKDLFYDQTPSAGPAVAPVAGVPVAAVAPVAGAASVVTTPAVAIPSLSLKYRIQLIDKNCNFSEVTEAYNFHSGDRIRFVFETNMNGFLYIFLRGSTGNAYQLFPDPRINGGNNFIQAHSQYSVPVRLADNGGWFKFDQNSGLEQLVVFFSPNVIQPLVGIIVPQPVVMLGYPVTPAGWTFIDAQVRATAALPAGTRDLTYEGSGFPGEVGYAQPTMGYVALQGPMLVHSMVLKHLP